MRARKLLAASLVLAAGVLRVTACGQGGSGAGNSGGKVTMTFWNNATQGDGTAFWDKTGATPVFFSLFQRRIVGGLTGAVKG